MTEPIIGLKLETYDSFAECVKIIRQYQNNSIADIKKRVDTHDYILCYPCVDAQGVKNVISCYEKLTSIGATVSLYELDHRLTTIELVRNRDRMYDEISADVEAAILAESDGEDQ